MSYRTGSSGATRPGHRKTPRHRYPRLGRPHLVRLGARPAPAGEPPLLVAGLDRLRGELAWTPRFTLDRGLADTVAWWRKQSREAA